MHRMFVRTALAVTMALVVPLAGCGSGDDEPAGSESGEPAAEQDAGETATDADDAGTTGERGDPGSGSGRPDSVREDFRIPFPTGWEKDLLGEIGMTETSGAQLLYPLDAYDDVVAFYDEWFESQPEEHIRSVQSDGFIVYQQLGETLYQVTVAPDYEERGETWVALQVSGEIEGN